MGQSMKLKLNFPGSHILSGCIAALLLAGCGSGDDKEPMDAAQSSAADAADTVYVNGRVYTVDEGNSWAQAVAVKDGKILAVGTNAEIEALVDGSTQVNDLGGKMLMPGIHDMHVHPKEAGEKYNFQCSFESTATMGEIVERITECAAETPKGEWIRGGQWAMEMMQSDTVPHKSILDAITTEHPIYLGDSTVHGAWLNSKALEMVGINAETPDPDGGVIMRDKGSREPTGILVDNAAYDVLREIPPYTEEQYQTALAYAVARMNEVGVTTMKDALSDTNTLKAYRALDNAGKLNMKVAASIGWKMAWADTPEQEQENIRIRDEYRSKNVNPDFAKIMADGIPPTRTAAMLDPYLPDEEHGDNFTGKLIHTPEQLNKDVTYLDAQGMTVKIHATGDRAARAALDAFEAARKANGDSGLMHEVSHAELIHPDDLSRFKELGVIAEMCPILWYPGPLVGAMAQVVGEEKANRFWPTKSLLEAGALLIYGSDWPSVVPDPSPWPGIESLVTRMDPYGKNPGYLWKEQAIDLPTAVRMFTYNGSIAAKTQDKTGSIEAGKAADFIVLNQNIFEVPIEDVSETKVLLTVVDGREVYAAP